MTTTLSDKRPLAPGAPAPQAHRATLHMIGNAHIDPVWLWRWPEGCHEVLASFRSALDRMDDDPEFIFVSSSAVFYEWVERLDPAMFEEIRRRVREGRWEVVGGWWVQPDCNLPGGEAFARHGLYAQRWFHQKLGVTARVGYNVDSFGHAGTLPQILRLSGMDAYVFMRPNPQEKGLPGRLFHWEGDDGSRVLAYRIPFEYCTWGEDLERHVRRVAGELRAPLDELMCFYGVGNHGGGPTRENLRSISRLRQEEGLPRLAHSSPNRFFAAVEARATPLPTYHGDLQHHASGCYAAHSAVKYWNRRAEWALLTAEKWAAVAAAVGGPSYPRDELTRAWRGVLFNQFHDILAGTSIETAYEDARNLYGEALSIADRALAHATVAVAWNVRTPFEEGVRPLVVCNAHAWPARVQVETEFGPFKEGHSLVDDQGRQVAVQLVQSEATALGRSRLCFTADLPALGYRTYRVVPRPPQPAPEDPFEGTGQGVLENRYLRVTFDPETGYISSLFDKEARVEALAGPAAVPVVVRDESDTWGHNVFSFREEAGRFVATSVRLLARGPARATMRVVSAYGQSRLVQELSLTAGGRTLEARATVDWRERHRALKLRFPINVHFHRATSEQPFGSIERFANGEEEPGQGWVDLSGTSRASGELYGVSILNDGKYSYDVHIRDIGLTVLRSPIYAHHDPLVPQAGEEYSYIDQGVQRFRYAVYPHVGGWEEAETVRQAAQLNQPPIVVQGTFHPDGALPSACAFADARPANIVITALKQAEDGDDLVVRAYESAKVATAAQILLPAWGRVISAVFRPGEIKTWRVPRDSSAPAREVNLLEWETA